MILPTEGIMRCINPLQPILEATRLLRLRVRILPGAWMPVWCECCLCDGPITRPEESYRLVVCMSVTAKPQQRRTIGPRKTVEPWGGGKGGACH